MTFSWKPYGVFACLAGALCLLATPSCEGVAVALVLLLPAGFLKEKAATVVMAVLAELLALVCLVDLYCLEFFASTLNVALVQVIHDTGAHEAGEFLRSFVSWEVLSKWRLDLAFLIMLAIPFAGRLAPDRKWARWLVAALWVPGILGLVSLARNSQDALAKTPPTRYVTSLCTIHRDAMRYNHLRESTMSALPDSCDFLSPHVVLVIGESFNKHHASAYGYPLETTPLLEKRIQEGSVTCFTDAVSAGNFTVSALTSMFSLTPDGPLFPVLLRKAGYQVNFYSHQYPTRKTMREGGSGNFFFLRDTSLCHQLFDRRNPRALHFDIDMVRRYCVPPPEDTPTVDILQFIGQHFQYENRYPAAFAHFSDADYASRNLSDEALLAVQRYDNATRYHDWVLDTLLSCYQSSNTVVVYVSDHGEEIFDELPMHGRSHGKPGPAAARAEFEVPMWIWCSPSYADTHPDIVARIREAASRPFYTRDISQLILGLTGLHSAWTRPDLDILSPIYIPPRRLLVESVDYDALMKE